MPDDLPPPVTAPGFVPEWSLPIGVKAWQSTRGVGPLPYGGFNLGDHVGDDQGAVQLNRQRLLSVLPRQPVWLAQVHGTRVITLTGSEGPAPLIGDAVLTSVPGIVCAIMTADCLPVLLADRLGRVVGAAHAGWRGLADGVLEALVDQMMRHANVHPSDLLAWLGPAIGPDAFEVGTDVREAFLRQSVEHARCFRPQDTVSGKWLADLPGLAKQKLERLGVALVTGSDTCTYHAPDFYSYRREKITGRMASMIWIEA